MKAAQHRAASGSCVTGSGGGSCTITKSNIKANSASVTFTMDNVTHATYSYMLGDNYGDSIVISYP